MQAVQAIPEALVHTAAAAAAAAVVVVVVVVVVAAAVAYTVRGKILEWEKIGEFGELWSLRQYFTRQ